MKIFHQTGNSQGNYNYNVYVYNEIYYPPHFHKNYEIVYVIRGRCLYSINGREQILEEGDFAFCLSYEIHSVKNLGEASIWIGVFSEDFIAAFKKRTEGKIPRDFKFRCGESVRRFFVENLIESRQEDVLMLKACLYALCHEFLNGIELLPRIDRRGVLMYDVIEYIETHDRRTLTLGQMADDLGYDYCYLSRAFNKLFSMSFNEYLNAFRVDCAVSLLGEGGMTMTEIAFESGFQSIRSFNDVFKKQTGLSPSRFQKQMRENKEAHPSEAVFLSANQEKNEKH